MVDKKLSEFDEFGLNSVGHFPILTTDTKNGKLSASNVLSRTNCILEIPRDIKLSLTTAGVLTLESGSILTKPDGTTITLSSDKTYTYTSGTSTRMVFYNINSAGMQSAPINSCYSGSTAPSGSGTMYWFDTTNNVIKQSTNGGSSWDSNVRSLPIAIIQVTSGAITSIENVFNGFGYIGSTFFALPGIKGFYPNGRNADGTLKNGTITTSSVLYNTGTTANWTAHIMVLSNSISAFSNVYYDEDRNILWNSGNAQISRLYCGTYTRGSDGRISGINIKNVFRAVDMFDLKKTNNSLDALSSSLSDLSNSAIKTTGNQSKSGVMTFNDQVITEGGTSGGSTTGFYYLKNLLYTLGTAPSSEIDSNVVWHDSTGAWAALVNHKVQTSGAVRMALQCRKPDKSTSTYISVGYDSNGNSYTYAPTPSSLSDDSNNIVTTEFLKDYITTNSSNAFSTWTKSGKGGFKLANGLIVNWGRATSTTITFAVPFSSNTSYSVSTAVGGTEQAATSWGQVNSLTSTGMTVVGASSSRTIYWLAIGY